MCHWYVFLNVFCRLFPPKKIEMPIKSSIDRKQLAICSAYEWIEWITELFSIIFFAQTMYKVSNLLMSRNKHFTFPMMWLVDVRISLDFELCLKEFGWHFFENLEQFLSGRKSICITTMQTVCYLHKWKVLRKRKAIKSKAA